MLTPRSGFVLLYLQPPSLFQLALHIVVWRRCWVRTPRGAHPSRLTTSQFSFIEDHPALLNFTGDQLFKGMFRFTLVRSPLVTSTAVTRSSLWLRPTSTLAHMCESAHGSCYSINPGLYWMGYIMKCRVSGKPVPDFGVDLQLLRCGFRSLRRGGWAGLR